MVRVLLIAALLTGPAVTVAPIAAASAATPSTQCADTPQKKAKRSLFGGIASGHARRRAWQHRSRRNRRWRWSPCPPPRCFPTRSSSCSTARSSSRRRERPTRRSAAASGPKSLEERKPAQRHPAPRRSPHQNSSPTAAQCLTVTDVVIVDGEETTVPKRMCRARGASGYARVGPSDAGGRGGLQLATLPPSCCSAAWPPLRRMPDNPTCPEALNWSTYRQMRFTFEQANGARVLRAEGVIDEDVPARLEAALADECADRRDLDPLAGRRRARRQ